MKMRQGHHVIYPCRPSAQGTRPTSQQYTLKALFGGHFKQAWILLPKAYNDRPLLLK